MREIQIFIAFAGFVALLLWGVRMVQAGVQRGFGKALSAWMRTAMGTAHQAFAIGLLVTAAIQSSTATGLLVSNFAVDGLVALVPGLAAMLGANVGTTLIVQVLSFNLSALAPALILAGVWMYRHYDPGRRRDIGRVLVGLGLLLLSLQELVAIFEPVKSAPSLLAALEFLRQTPSLALVASVLITWASHSSVAVVILIMSLASNGLIDAETAYILVLGANVGTAINPILETTTDGNPAQRRVPVGNMGTRLAGCAVALALLPWSGQVMQFMSSDNARAVANFHLVFNVLVALCFMPFLRHYSRLLQWLLPQKVNPDDPMRPRYLDNSSRGVPTIIVSQAKRESLRMTDLLAESLTLTRQSFARSDDGVSILKGRQLNQTINQLYRAISTFIAQQDREIMGAEDEHALKNILTFSLNITRAAGVSDARLLNQSELLRYARWGLTPEQESELADLLKRVQGNLRQATALFVSPDRDIARELAFEKDYFRALEARTIQRNLHHGDAADPAAFEASSFYLEIIGDIADLNGYLVEAIAYPILQDFGELRPNRLQKAAPTGSRKPGHS
ncbi:MAG: Na/Pi cotransporter family protein [Ottowia sp.]|nr:Na/Pi cotransporter family protein [Ottowia sp.]